MKQNLIEIGYDKNGELDFGINGLVQCLSYEQIKELRSMVCTAIYVAEDSWHREQERKSPAACQMPKED